MSGAGIGVPRRADDFRKVAYEIAMNKMTSFYIWYGFLVSMTVLVLAGCGLMTPTIIPTAQSPSATSPYIHYTPPKGVNVHLEFDYPSSWVFSETKTQGIDFISIGLGDSRFRTIPTLPPDPDYVHSTPNDFGVVNIWILPSKPGQTPDTELASYKKDYSGTGWILVLDDYEISIDGFDASVLEYQITDPESFTSPMFARRIFFIVNDQFYEIYFTVAVKDRGGEFEKGYEYFFNSIKIMP